MEIQFTFRPLARWPRKDTEVRRCRPFQTDYEAALRGLGDEIGALGATGGATGSAIIQAQFRQQDLRLDGLPRTDAREPGHPGVIVSFTAEIAFRETPLQFLCDDCVSWRDNLHAIGLTLERLRLADRYGVTKNGEQYTGWRALPPPIPAAPPMDLREAFIFFGSPAAAEFNDRYRELAKRFHPDTGGRPDDWLRFQRASEILRKHFAGKK